MTAWPKPSGRFWEYVRKVKSCGHWECDGRKGSDVAVIRHVASGATLAYQLHDGGNDLNSARNFAASAQQVCGCKFVEQRSRKRSRKAPELTGFSPTSSFSNPTQATVDRLNAQWRGLDEQVAVFEALGSAATRSQINEALAVIRRRMQVEQKLRDLHQPTPERRQS